MTEEMVEQTPMTRSRFGLKVQLATFNGSVNTSMTVAVVSSVSSASSETMS